MPVRLVPTTPSVPIADVRASMPVEHFEDPGISFRPSAGSASSTAFRRGEKDPAECWVLFRIEYDGTIGIDCGSHAVEVMET